MFLRSPRGADPRPLLTADTVKTGLLIGVVTVVIWLFAEAKSITELAVESEIRLVAGDDRTIRFTGVG